MDKRIQALIAVAKAYLDRGAYLQYDDSRLVAGDVVEPPVYRWHRHVNSPEDATSQHTCYTNCAAFCYDVYKETLDLDIVTWCTEMMINAADMQAFRYEVRGDESDSEKQVLESAYRNALRPGDIIVSRHSLPRGGGHAMLYIGDDKIIHSSAPGGGSYDYEGKKDRTEKDGSIAYMELSELFDPNHKRYLFGELNFAIIRPLMKYSDAQLTAGAENRLLGMQGIVAEKLCSHVTGQTAEAGENITFKFSIRNRRQCDAKVDITDTVPSMCSYVSGGEYGQDGTVRWSLSIPAGESVCVAYTVRVNNDAQHGSFVQTVASVGGVPVKCPKVYISGHLSEQQQSRIYMACMGIGGAETTDDSLASLVYDKADIDLTAERSVKKMLNAIFRPYKETNTHFELDTDGELADIVVPTMYGGRYVATSEKFCGVRTSGIFARELMAGDIVLAAEDAAADNVRSFVYAGKGICAAVSDGTVQCLDTEECDNVLMSMPGYYMFAVIRPSMK